LEPDIDDIEVLRNHGPREDLARLARDLGAEVAIGQVRQREHPHLRGLGDGGRAGSGRVQRLVRALALLRRKRCLVHQDIGLARHLEHGRSRRGVAREDDLPPGARRPQDLVGADRSALGQVDGLAGLEAAEQRSFRNAQRPRGLQVEAPGPRKLGERIAVCSDAVRDPEDEDPILAAVEHVAVAKLDELDAVRELPEDPLKATKELLQPWRPVDRERELPAAQGERLQHPWKPEVVVRVVVREEDLGELDQPDARPQELPLRPLAAIHEHPLTASAHEEA
jgi:hypothetical protein